MLKIGLSLVIAIITMGLMMPDFEAKADAQVQLEAVFIDNSNIIHMPQEYDVIPLIPQIPDISPFTRFSIFSAASEVLPAGISQAYEIGNTRSFYLNNVVNGSNVYRTITGRVIAQGEHSNVWILDHNNYHAQSGIRACGTHCTLASFTTAMANEIAVEFDAIYKAMTDETTGFASHAGVVVNMGYLNQPYVGDIGSDGKINILLYDINDDGSPAKVPYTAGFFANSDFFTYNGSQLLNGLDMFHMDIGMEQGFNAFVPNAAQEAVDAFFGTLAHELQHMLFYMHYIVYRPSTGYENDLWINETFSEMAHAYYTRPGVELIDATRIQGAAGNDYGTSGGFLNFQQNLKSYGIARMFAHWMYKTNSHPASKFYGNIRAQLPTAENNAKVLANTAKITNGGGMRWVMGNALKAATNSGDGDSDTISKLYFQFMESLGTDGGGLFVNVVNGNDVEAQRPVKCITENDPPTNNLWAVRPVMGVSGGRVFTTRASSISGYGLAYDLSSATAIPTLNSGGTIAVSGIRERFFKLSSPVSGKPVLDITVPSGGSGDILYYVAVPQDNIVTGGGTTRTTGENGATLYLLNKGEVNSINTNGRIAYLLVVTFDGNVNATVTYSWEAVALYCKCEFICNYCDGCRDCRTINPITAKNCDCSGTDCYACDCFILGDVNNDGRVTISDALQILMCLAKMDESLLFGNNVDPRAMRAALITKPYATRPTISDAISVLMYLAEIDGIIDGSIDGSATFRHS